MGRPRGDERPRGFKGHLGAAGAIHRRLVKLVAGAVCGTAAGALVSVGGRDRRDRAVPLVALGANLVNLFDRAPGRAGKVAPVRGGH